MTNLKSWVKAHLAELIGSLAALGLLVVVWLNSRKSSSGTVAPASIQTPAAGSSGSSGAQGPTASDVQAAIQQALAGYTTTAQEQSDLSNLNGSFQQLLSTASSQLQQAEQQDQQTQTNNLASLAQQFQQASQQWAQQAAQLTGTQQQQAQQIAQASQQASQAAQAASTNSASIDQLNLLRNISIGRWNGQTLGNFIDTGGQKTATGGSPQI